MTGSDTLGPPGWCQRWRTGRHTFRHTSQGGFNPDRYQVVPLAEATARAFVTTHHYTHTYPAARMAFGLLCDTDTPEPTTGTDTDRTLVGVAVLGVPMSAAVLTNVFPHLAPYTESLELSRFVLLDGDDAPANAESYFLARTFTAAAATHGIRGVVAFSDPVPRWHTGPDGEPECVMPGHVGTVYQATNAVALGRSTPRTLRVANGQVLSERSLSKVRSGDVGAAGTVRRLVELGARPLRPGQDPTRWLNDTLDRIGAAPVRHPGNFRYAWATGTPAQRRTVTMTGTRTGYPKADLDVPQTRLRRPPRTV